MLGSVDYGLGELDAALVRGHCPKRNIFNADT